MLVRLIGESELAVGVNGCLFLRVGLVTDWRPVRGGTPPPPRGGWDRPHHGWIHLSHIRIPNEIGTADTVACHGRQFAKNKEKETNRLVEQSFTDWRSNIQSRWFKGERKNSLWPKAYLLTSSVKHACSFMTRACMPASRAGTVIYDFTDESNSMKEEVYRGILCVHIHYLLGQLS